MSTGRTCRHDIYGEMPVHLSYAGSLAADIGIWLPGVDLLEDIPEEFVRMGREVERIVDREVAQARRTGETMSTPMQPDDPAAEIAFDNDELTDADLPEEWPERIRQAYWRACNAPTYAETQKETLAFARLLEELHT